MSEKSAPMFRSVMVEARYVGFMGDGHSCRFDAVWQIVLETRDGSIIHVTPGADGDWLRMSGPDGYMVLLRVQNVESAHVDPGTEAEHAPFWQHDGDWYVDAQPVPLCMNTEEAAREILRLRGRNEVWAAKLADVNTEILRLREQVSALMASLAEAGHELLTKRPGCGTM